MTPLLVSVTLGSIVNGRLIPRVAHPERLFSFGVLLLIVGMGLLCTVSAATPRGLLMAVFALCGLSLGFQLPNLTLQMQSAVGQADQGAVSALIQTLRTLGSMFGASLAGLLVSLGHRLGFDTANLLEHARLGLVSGIREAFLACLLLALISYWVSRRLPPFIRRQ